jgi:hypothetical protein
MPGLSSGKILLDFNRLVGHPLSLIRNGGEKEIYLPVNQSPQRR